MAPIMTDTEQLNIFDGFFKDLITEMTGSANKLTKTRPRTNKEGGGDRLYAVPTSDDFDYAVKDALVNNDSIKRKSIIDFLISDDFFDYLKNTYSQYMYDYHVFYNQKNEQAASDRKNGFKESDIIHRSNIAGYLEIIINEKTSNFLWNNILKMLDGNNKNTFLQKIVLNPEYEDEVDPDTWKEIKSGKQPIDIGTFLDLDTESKMYILDAFCKTKEYKKWFDTIKNAKRVQDSLGQNQYSKCGLFKFTIIDTEINYGYEFEKPDDTTKKNLINLINYNIAGDTEYDENDFPISEVYFWLIDSGITREKLSECPGFMYMMNNELSDEHGDPSKAIRNLSMVKTKTSETFDVPYAGNKYVESLISGSNPKTFSQILNMDLSGLINGTGIQTAKIGQMSQVVLDAAEDLSKISMFVDRPPASLMDFYTKTYLIIKFVEYGPLLKNAISHISNNEEKTFAENLVNVVSNMETGLMNVDPILIPVVQYAQFFDPRTQKSISTNKRRYAQVAVGKRPTRTITVSKTANDIKSVIEHGLFSAAIESVESSMSNDSSSSDNGSLSSILGTTIKISSGDTDEERITDSNIFDTRLDFVKKSMGSKFKNPVRRYIVTTEEMDNFLKFLEKQNPDNGGVEYVDAKNYYNDIGHYVNNFMNYNLVVNYIRKPSENGDNIWKNTTATVYKYTYSVGGKTMSTKVCSVIVPMAYALFKLIYGADKLNTTGKGFSNVIYNSISGNGTSNDTRKNFHTILKATISQYMRLLAGKMKIGYNEIDAYKFLYKADGSLIDKFSDYILPNFVPDDSFLNLYCTDLSKESKTVPAINIIKNKLDSHMNFLRMALFYFINVVSKVDLFDNGENEFDDNQIKPLMNKEFNTLSSNMATRMGTLTGLVYSMMNVNDPAIVGSKRMPNVINSVVQYTLQNTLRYNRIGNYYRYIKNNKKLVNFLYDKKLTEEIIEAIDSIFPKNIRKAVIGHGNIQQMVNDYKTNGMFDIEDPNAVFNNIGVIFNGWLSEIAGLRIILNEHDFSFSSTYNSLENTIKRINVKKYKLDDNEKQVLFDILMCVSDVIFMLYRIILSCRTPQTGLNIPSVDRTVILPTSSGKNETTKGTVSASETKDSDVNSINNDPRWNTNSDQFNSENIRQSSENKNVDDVVVDFNL